MAELQEFYRHKHVLITGSTGYIATALVQWLAGLECCITRLSRPGTLFPPIDSRAEITDVAADIGERTLWERLLDKDVEVIFHLAAQTNCYVSNAGPPADQAANLRPLLQLLETCRESGRRPNIVLAGTVTQAGLPERLPVDEDHPDRPATIYDLHKLVAEHYLAVYGRLDLAHGVTLRLTNVYGPGPESSGAGRGMLNAMVRRALQGEPLTIYGQGQYVRDFIYIEDVRRAFLLAGAAAGRVKDKHYLIGSSRGTTITEAICLVAERAALQTGKRPPIIHIEPPPTLLPIEFRHFVADTSRAAEELAWRPQVSLEQGIDRTIAYFLDTSR